MQANPVARVYAEALFAIARESSLADDVGRELQEFLELVQRERDIGLFFSSPVLDPGVKIGLLKSALAERASGILTDFLCLLVEKRRFTALPLIVAAYRDMADEHAGRVRVGLDTAVSLPDPLREEIEAALRSGLEREIALEARTRPDLLGGAVITIGDRVYDGSIRTRLSQFRKQIMRSGGYEDQG